MSSTEPHVIQRHERPTRLLVLLCGNGAVPRDLTPLGPMFVPDERWLIVGPAPPLDDGDSPTWFRSTARGPDPHDVSDAIELIRTTLAERCAELGLAPRDCALVGFSQGAALALLAAYGPDSPGFGAVAAICGWLPDVEGFELVTNETPALVLVGQDDQVVPADFGLATVESLRALGASVTRAELDSGHAHTVESVRLVRDWLASVIE